MKREIALSIKNIFFLLPLILLICISIMHGYFTITEYNDFISSLSIADKSEGNLCFPIYTSFNLWIGNSNSIFSIILFYIAPFFAALPYSWSYCRDKKKYVSKLVGVFVSSGMMIAVPLILNFLGVSCFIPSIEPDSVYSFYYGIFSNNFIGVMFYKAPYLYILFYIIINFIIYGLLGCVGMSFSTVFESRYMAVFFPIMIIVIIEVLKVLLSRLIHVEVSLLSYMYPANSFNDSGAVLLLEVVLLLLTVIVFSKIGVKNSKYES